LLGRTAVARAAAAPAFELDAPMAADEQQLGLF
jgi:hypothetical protein